MGSQNLKKRIIDGIIKLEAGYVNDPSDSGGETNFGVTIAVARDNGYEGEMEHLPYTTAFDIYSTQYWDVMKADHLARISERVAEEVVDTCINMGPKRAGVFLQRALNVLNVNKELYLDLKVDGHVGVATLRALRSYTSVRSVSVLMRVLNCLQGEYYVSLAERRTKDERFIYGWFKNRVKL